MTNKRLPTPPSQGVQQMSNPTLNSAMTWLRYVAEGNNRRMTTAEAQSILNELSRLRALVEPVKVIHPSAYNYSDEDVNRVAAEEEGEL